MALSRLGHEVGWISRLGNDDFGLYIRNFIRGEGVDTTNVLFDKNYQTAVFFKERKNGERNLKSIIIEKILQQVI
ncbi:MAG TPA: PfkB family carbohydrate kinase [Metabacillus sp.]|nr:PfkB family carbohydrate kinase [Metabacillus sp.]